MEKLERRIPLTKDNLAGSYGVTAIHTPGESDGRGSIPYPTLGDDVQGRVDNSVFQLCLNASETA